MRVGVNHSPESVNQLIDHFRINRFVCRQGEVEAIKRKLTAKQTKSELETVFAVNLSLRWLNFSGIDLIDHVIYLAKRPDGEKHLIAHRFAKRFGGFFRTKIGLDLTNGLATEAFN